MIVLRPFGVLVWLERTSADEPYWWNYDKDGNKFRRILGAEMSYDKLSSSCALKLFCGRYKATVGIRRK